MFEDFDSSQRVHVSFSNSSRPEVGRLRALEVRRENLSMEYLWRNNSSLKISA